MAWLYVPGLSLVCPCAQAQVDLTSGCTSQSPTIELSATSSGTPMRRPSSWPGWKTRPWRRRVCGTICAPSTADAGVDAWTSSLRATRASRSALPASAAARTTSAISGRTSAASSSRRDRSGSSSRTSAVGDAKSSGSRNTETSSAKFGVSLTDAALGSFGTGRSSRPDHRTTTPGEASSSADQTSLPRSLNPSFVEWLMGWPHGWTDCASREMGLIGFGSVIL